MGTKYSKHEPMGDISTSKPSMGSPWNKEQRLLQREFHRGLKVDMEWPRAGVGKGKSTARETEQRALFSNPIGGNAVRRPALLFTENSNGIEAAVWPRSQTQAEVGQLGGGFSDSSWRGQVYPSELREKQERQSGTVFLVHRTDFFKVTLSGGLFAFLLQSYPKRRSRLSTPESL